MYLGTRTKVILVFLIIVLLLLVLSSIPPQQANNTSSATRTFSVELVRAGWAGYAEQTTPGNYATFVNGTWTLPSLNCTAEPNSSVLMWVGLGGNQNDSIEQVGTRSDCTDGIPFYYGWYELWPSQPSTQPIAGFQISPGNKIHASVSYSNVTRMFSFSISGNQTRPYSFDSAWDNSSLSSAEWMVEAPGYSNHSRVALANFSQVQFSEGFATIGNHTGSILDLAGRSYSGLNEWTYVCGNDTRAQPGSIDPSFSSFSVMWVSGGACKGSSTQTSLSLDTVQLLAFSVTNDHSCPPASSLSNRICHLAR